MQTVRHGKLRTARFPMMRLPVFPERRIAEKIRAGYAAFAASPNRGNADERTGLRSRAAVADCTAATYRLAEGAAVPQYRRRMRRNTEMPHYRRRMRSSRTHIITEKINSERDFQMFAVYKREMRSYFTTSAGYVFCAVFLAASGLLFGLLTMEITKTTDVSMYYQALMFAYIIILPLLTMKSFAEERRTRTEQLLMTSPVGLFSIVAAKFLAAFTLFFCTIAVTALYFIPLSLYGEFNWGRAFGCMIAVIFVGMCFIAIGIFISSLTANQFTAGLGTIGVLLALMGISLSNSLIDFYPVRKVLAFISIYARYAAFTNGIFDFSAAFYYLSICAIFLFLAYRVYEKRRWS